MIDCQQTIVSGALQETHLVSLGYAARPVSMCYAQLRIDTCAASSVDPVNEERNECPTVVLNNKLNDRGLLSRYNAIRGMV